MSKPLRRLLSLSFALSLLLGAAPSYSQTKPDIEAVYARLQQLTLERSPDVRTAVANETAKSAARWTAFTRWAPRLDLRLSRTTAKDYSALSSGSLGDFANLLRPQETTLSAYQIVAQAPLYNRGVHVGVRTADAEAGLARVELDLARSRIEWSLRQLFGDYLLKAYKLATVDRSLELARSNLKEAQARFKLGDRTVIDVLKAQAQQAQLDARQVTFESDLAQSHYRLLDGTGLEAKELSELGTRALVASEADLAVAIEKFADSPATVAAILQYPLEREALGEKVKEGAVFRRVQLESEAERAKAKSLAATEWPELLARATLGKQSDDWSRSFSTPETSYSYGLVLNIPFFSFGSLFSLNREASALETASEIRRRRSSEDLVNNVHSLVLRGRALAKSLESFRFSRDKNAEIERLTARTYQLGKATFLDLQIAQNDHLDSKIQLAQAQIDLAVLLWQIRWNIGAVHPQGGRK